MFFKGFLSSVKEKVLSVKEKVLSVKKSVMSFLVAPLVLASGSALAAGATTTTTAIDFSSLQTAINFTSVIGIFLFLKFYRLLFPVCLLRGIYRICFPDCLPVCSGC